MERKDEEHLVFLAQAGDHRAFDELFRRYERPLFRHAYRMLGEEAASYDALQETWLVIVRKIGQLRSRSAFRAWTYGIVTRVCLKARRRFARRHEDSSEWTEPTDDGPRPERLAAAREELDGLLDQIVLLTPKLRSVVLLHFFEGLTLVEVAAALELSVGTVKSRLHAALLKLRPEEQGA